MAKHKLTVTTEHGTFTRTTARTYAFLVAARGRRVDEINHRRERERIYLTKELAKYRAVVESGIVPANFRSSSTLDDYRRYAANTAVEIEHLDAKYDREIVEAEAAAGAPFAAGGASWSSRFDLARREADKLRTFYRDVRIFDVATGAEVAPVR